MIAHSVSRRSLKALPQREATIYLDSTVPALRLTDADACIAVKSARREHRYYVVRFNASLQIWQCSCGLDFHNHDHITTAREYLEQHPIEKQGSKATQVQPQPSLPISQNRIESVENNPVLDKNTQITAEQWKAIYKADKARQKAWTDEYRSKAIALRTKQEPILVERQVRDGRE